MRLYGNDILEVSLTMVRRRKKYVNDREAEHDDYIGPTPLWKQMQASNRQLWGPKRK
jgi:hypothetical protein